MVLVRVGSNHVIKLIDTLTFKIVDHRVCVIVVACIDKHSLRVSIPANISIPDSLSIYYLKLNTYLCIIITVSLNKQTQVSNKTTSSAVETPTAL